MKKSVLYLYSDSVLTPNQENIFASTIAELLQSTPSNYYPFVTHFMGFDEQFASFLKRFDIIFNVCYGFDSYSQVDVIRWLEHNNIQHNASDLASQLLAMDKAQLPLLCKEVGINTPEILNVEDIVPNTAGTYLCKPRFGSCHRNIEIFSASHVPYQLLTESPDLLLQPYIEGREFTVGVIPNQAGDGYEALPPMEIRPDDERSIYVAGSSFGKTIRVFNPDLSTELQAKICTSVLDLHNLIGLKGMSRTDLRVTEDGEVYILDVNAMPNLDPRNSYLPVLAEHSGISYAELIRRLILVGESASVKSYSFF